MAGLNVTHQAIFGRSHLERLQAHRCGDQALCDTLESVVTFFADTYKSEFGFTSGPPVHDVLAVAYVVAPELFNCPTTGAPPKRYQVQVETQAQSLAMGSTVIDFYAKTCQRPEEEWWGRGGRNAIVLEHLDVSARLDEREAPTDKMSHLFRSRNSGTCSSHASSGVLNSESSWACLRSLNR